MPQYFALSLTPDAPAQHLSVLKAYELVVLGIVVSILLPMLRGLLPSSSGTATAIRPYWDVVKPYVVIGAVSLIAAVIVVAFAGDAVQMWTWQNALLAGYAWDSTLQKLGKKP